MSESINCALPGSKELMQTRLERFCGYDTSSITIERAQEVMRSTAYVIAQGQKVLNSSSAETQCDAMSGAIRVDMQPHIQLTAQLYFYAGKSHLAKRIKVAHAALEFARQATPISYNTALMHTLGAGLELFFKKYDVEFGAHEIPGDIDYPLCIPIDESVEGLDYIEEYLRRITYEQIFLEALGADYVSAVLAARYASPRELVINIFLEALDGALMDTLRAKCRPEIVKEDGTLCYSRAQVNLAATILSGKLVLEDRVTNYVQAAASDMASYIALRNR